MAPAEGSPPSSQTRRTALDDVRYMIFGRVVPAVLFALLALKIIAQVGDLPTKIRQSSSLYDVATGPTQQALYLAFVCIPVGIYIARPRPKARDGSILARIAAFVGTTILLVFGAYFGQGTSVVTLPDAVHWFASVTLVASTALEVYSIAYLRLNFSIIPEARALVRSGPYRFVRHPLYLAEIGAATSVVIQGNLRLGATLILIPFIALQMLRTVYEERLLRQAFPEYEGYSKTTSRLIPGIV